ncbi:MAG: hypothetical protein KKG06_01475 [Bacteroidetes bacterium]|nr:hypothetical protein [Bacteroidota bacterium]MBU1421849.1 hypothetical protein [Bacteroidota bacterium]
MLDDSFIADLLEKEDDSVISVMAFMSYNPSIGRVLQKGGVRKFQKWMLKMVLELNDVSNMQDFDKLHKKYLNKIITQLKTSNNSSVSFGQAQKPINVFLKVFMDWARKPNEEMRDKILPFLHVPLDSILMKTIKKKYPEWYKTEIKPSIKNIQQEFSLSKIDYNLYCKWQQFFRKKYRTKPLVFDVAWALNR